MSSIRLTTSHTSLASAWTHGDGRFRILRFLRPRPQGDIYGVGKKGAEALHSLRERRGPSCSGCVSKRFKRDECETCFSVLVSELDAQRIHGSKDGRQALDGVAVDHRLILLHVIPRETILVNNPARPHTHTQVRKTCVKKQGNTKVYLRLAVWRAAPATYLPAFSLSLSLSRWD